MSQSTSAPKRRLLRPTNSLPLENALAQHTTEAHNARNGVKEDVTMSLMNVGWRVRKNVTEGYKTGPPQAIPTPPPLKHVPSSFSTSSTALGMSYSSSDGGSLRSAYTNPAISGSSSIFLSSSDALYAAKASIRQDQQREREQIALLNSLRPRRDLMCLADVVDVDADLQSSADRGGFAVGLPRPLDAVRTDYARADNYHLHNASRPIPLSTSEEEPYRVERGRKRQTVEEDEGEATETDDMDDAQKNMDVDQESDGVSHRPIRPIRRAAGIQASSAISRMSTSSSRNRCLRPTRSAPVDSLQLSFGNESSVMQVSEERGMGLEGGLSAWVGRTDF